jgi:hypothetical protein
LYYAETALPFRSKRLFQHLPMRRQQIFECPMRPALRKLPKSFDEYSMPQILVRTIKRSDSNFAMAGLMYVDRVQKKR